jgi:Na+-driven multidrug efflux pump
MTFFAALLSTVAFAAFRGTLDIVTPLKISVFSNLVNVIMDPVLIFGCGMGVPGAALATCMAELSALLLYVRALSKRSLLSVRSVITLPSRRTLVPLLIGGASVQIRAMAINAALIAVTRTTQRLDTTGTAAAAHAIALQLFQLGSVASMALSVTASVVIPSVRAKAVRENGSMAPVKQAADRLLLWGLIVGTTIGALQLLSLPLLRVFTPLKEVQAAARVPALIGAVLQTLNCVVWTGEGVQQGNEDFTDMAVATSLGTAAMLIALRSAGDSLAGVWASFGLLALFRLLGTLRHHYYTGPWVKEVKKS